MVVFGKAVPRGASNFYLFFDGCYKISESLILHFQKSPSVRTGTVNRVKNIDNKLSEKKACYKYCSVEQNSTFATFDKMSDSSQGADSDEEFQGNGPFVDPYASAYGFTASSWQLRKNLKETFDQHVVEKEKTEKKRMVESHTFSANHKIAKYEQQNLQSVATHQTGPMGKPPRNPSSSQQPSQSNAGAQDKGRVSVYLRIRPPKTGMGNTIEIIPSNDAPPTKVRTHAPAKSNAAKINRDRGSKPFQSDTPTVVREFEFEDVFGPETQNQDVYTNVVAPMVDRMFPSKVKGKEIERESGLLFAYGSTNAGKTYSMLGKAPAKKKDALVGDQKHWGIVPRAISALIQKITMCGQRFDLYLSYFEIYNENIYDLLDDQSSRSPMYTRESLKLRESQNKNIIIRGLQKRHVKSGEEGLKLAMQANAKRQTSSNNLNTDSSRSHCICQLQVVQRELGVLKAGNGSAASNGYNTEEEATQISKLKSTTLSFVDLAGSERNKRTNVGSLRQKEASLINKSLMNLMRCLSIIRENQSTACNNQIIPFRENKLTHLFMPAFTGRKACRISMIVNVNPAAPDFDETNHVLSYAAQAKLVQIDKGNEFSTTRHTQGGVGGYDYNGRPIKKPSAASKLAKMVRKLSPKKLVQRVSNKEENKKTSLSNFARKRKEGPSITRVSSFSSTTSNGSQNLPKTKKMKMFKPATSSNPKPRGNGLPESGMNALKNALHQAKAEIELLKSEKSKLTDEAAQVEAKIRLEVSEEMEEQLESTKRHYTKIIDTMKSQSRQSLGVFEKKAREDKAAEQIEVLLFKVDECEEEMKRQAHEHQVEVLSKSKEIGLLKGELAKRRDISEGSNDDIVSAQRLKISEQQEELEALKKSKTDLIAAYEKLLAGEEDEEEDEEDSHEDKDNDLSGDEDLEQASPKPTSKYMTRNRSAQKKSRVG